MKIQRAIRRTLRNLYCRLHMITGNTLYVFSYRVYLFLRLDREKNIFRFLEYIRYLFRVSSKKIGIKTKKAYYLSALAIFKNQSPWLKEWIEYHRLVGVEHFYLYNNDDDVTESDNILAQYVEVGIVENIHFPGKQQQMSAYQNGIRKARGKTEWLAIIDLDEFIYPVKENNICDILKNYELYAGLVMNWKCFGSSGLLKRPPNQINHFVYRAKSNSPVDTHIKTIVKPELVAGIQNPHSFLYYKKWAVDEKFNRVKGAFNKTTTDIIQLNHYLIRSLQDFAEVKLVNGRADTVENTYTNNFFSVNDTNDVFDDGISQRFGKILFPDDQKTIHHGDLNS